MFLALRDRVAHLRDEGPPGAPAVLMLHSLGTNLHVWDPQAEVLARGHRVLRLDLPGHGLSAPGPGEETMEGLAADVLALLDRLGLAAVHLAGVSIGGRVAMEVAAEAPERVLSLFLLGTALEFPPPETWRSRIEAVRAGGTAAVEEPVLARWVTRPGTPEAEGLRAMLRNTRPEGYAALAAALRDARAEPLFGRIQAPATVVVGERDEATPPAAAEAIRRALPGSRLLRLPDAAHVPTLEHAEAVTAALLDHLNPRGADPYEAGLAVRRAVLGEAHVERATAAAGPLDAAFQQHITRSVWGAIWTRPGLSRRDRSLLTLAVTAALGRDGELRLHLAAAARCGVTSEEVGEVLLQVGAYAGVPAANHALKLAKEVLEGA